MWHKPRFRRRSALFRLERLEERTVLSSLLVTNNLDTGVSGDGSLRQKIAAADPGDTIVFDRNVHNITLTSGELQLTNDLDIKGPGASKLTISGNDSSRVFDVMSGTVAIAGLTITHGKPGNDPGTPLRSHGGGILNNTDAHLTLTDVVLSHNTAQGFLGINDELRHLGGGAGGGVANTGYLTVTGCTFIDNHAVGADGQNPIDGVIRFPGIGLGGGLWNWMTGTATVTDSRFIDNLAQAGSHCTGSFAGLANGGAILVFQGDATISQSVLDHNQAIGGKGAPGEVGGLAIGGGILFFNFLSRPTVPVTGVMGTVKDCALVGNEAIGGTGGDNEGRGGKALGGGIAAGTFGVSPLSGQVEVSNTLLAGNLASGGAGGLGGAGGDGRGGGVYNDTKETMTVTHSSIIFNLAVGGEGQGAGLDGQGIGGGVYCIGTFNYDSTTVIKKNHASSSNDDTLGV